MAGRKAGTPKFVGKKTRPGGGLSATASQKGKGHIASGKRSVKGSY